MVFTRDHTRVIDKDDFAGVRVNTVGRSKIGEKLLAGCETDGGGAGDGCLVENGDGHRIADRDEVSDI